MKGWLHAVLIGAAVVSTAEAKSPAAPDWMESSRQVKQKPGGHDIEVLFEEQLVDVSRADTRRRTRVAVKVLTSNGRFKRPLLAHQANGEDFKLVGGWRIRPDGVVTRYEPKSIVQYSTDDRLSFSMNRINTFWPDETRVGDVVGWEVQHRSKPEAYSESWRFGGAWPTHRSRFGIRMPPDWSMRSAARNTPEIAPGKDDDGYTVWEMRDIAPIRDELMQSPLEDVAPSLVIGYAPATGRADAARFDTWQDVSRWYATIVATQTVADRTIREAVLEITSGAATPLEGIRAIARFVQSVRYLNVAVGRSVAEPHPAAEILSNRFGDCEDKSVLTITMLGEYGVEAWPMLVLTADDGRVDAEFPSPQGFNHAIVAVRAPAGEALAATTTVGPLGSLVIFDPTNTTTGFGDLPWYLQGTRGVLAHSTAGGLIDLPVISAADSSRESESVIRLTETGSIEVTSRRVHDGQYASMVRAHYLSVRGEKRKEEIASHIASHYGSVQVQKAEVTGIESPDAPLAIDLDLIMPFPGRQAGSLRMMSTQFLFESRAPSFTEAKRETPVWLGSSYRESDRMVVEVPPGWKALDPLPGFKASSIAGEYSLVSRRDGDRIVIEREISVQSKTVQPSDYNLVREFFAKVRDGDTTALAMEKIGS